MFLVSAAWKEDWPFWRRIWRSRGLCIQPKRGIIHSSLKDIILGTMWKRRTQANNTAFTIDNEALQARNEAALIGNDSLSIANKADAVCSGTL